MGTPPMLPDPVADFPDLAKDFRLAADALVPGHVAAAVALNRDGSRVALVEYAIWGWGRNGPAIGKWDPPIHVLNFLPKQRGRLRVFDGSGKELFSETLPQEGLFEVGFSADANEVWCWPASWFAPRHGRRSMAACRWAGANALSRGAQRSHCRGVGVPRCCRCLRFYAGQRAGADLLLDGWIYLLTVAGKLWRSTMPAGPRDWCGATTAHSRRPGRRPGG